MEEAVGRWVQQSCDLFLKKRKRHPGGECFIIFSLSDLQKPLSRKRISSIVIQSGNNKRNVEERVHLSALIHLTVPNFKRQFVTKQQSCVVVSIVTSKQNRPGPVCLVIVIWPQQQQRPQLDKRMDQYITLLGDYLPHSSNHTHSQRYFDTQTGVAGD